MNATTISSPHRSVRPRQDHGFGSAGAAAAGRAPRAARTAGAAAAAEAAEELCAAVFTSLRRRDQRERGRQYVRGLLSVEGRKSIRNIAQQTGPGGAALEQSLHHFIAASTWDWRPIRAALSQYLGQSAPLGAWVAQPLAIPKGGEHSVGAGHRFDPHRGQMFRGQQAFGTWFTSAGVVTPVGWRLFGAGEEEPYEDCAVTGVLDTVRTSGLPVRPVVLDIRGIATRATLNRLAQARVPVVGRINPEARLLVTDPRLPGFGAGALAAREILQNVRGLRMPVEWSDPDLPGARRTSLVAAVRVMVPDPAPGRRREVLLFGEWESARRLPTQVWVTDMVRTDPGALVRMTKTAHRVSAASGTGVQEVGLRDFSGRSLPGWHRHVTLASVAHAARCLGAAAAPAAVPAMPAGPAAPAARRLVRRPAPALRARAAMLTTAH